MNSYTMSRRKPFAANMRLGHHKYVSYGYGPDIEGAKKSACRRFDEEFPDRERVTEVSCVQPDGTILTVVVWV